MSAPFTLENAVLAMTGDAVPVEDIRQILTWVVPNCPLPLCSDHLFRRAMGSRNQISCRNGWPPRASDLTLPKAGRWDLSARLRLCRPGLRLQVTVS